MNKLFVLFAVYALPMVMAACGGSVSRDAERSDVAIGEAETGATDEQAMPVCSPGDTRVCRSNGLNGVQICTLDEIWGDCGTYPDEPFVGEGGSPATGGSVAVEEGGSDSVLATGGSASHVPTSTGGNNTVPVENEGGMPDAGAGGSIEIIDLGTGGTLDVEPISAGAGGEGGSAGAGNQAGAGYTATGGSAGVPSVSNGGSAGGAEALQKLTMRLAEDTPETSIVVSGTIARFTKYNVFNPNGHDVSFVNTILHGSAGGSNADFASIRLTDCTEGGWEHVIVPSCGASEACHFPDTYGSHTSIYADFSSTESRFLIPAHGSADFCMDAELAETQPSSVADTADGRLARSGDTPNLVIGTVTTSDADIPDIQQPFQPPSMVLRKSAPMISWEEVTEPLHVGTNKLARIVISSTDQSRPVGIQQLWFFVEASEADMLTPSAVEVSLTVDHLDVNNLLTWEWDRVTPRETVGGHVNEHGVFMWEEAIPDRAYHARVMFYQDAIATPTYEGLVGPITVTLWAHVQSVHTGATVTTGLLYNSGSCPNRVVTTSLVLFNGNGLLSTNVSADWGEDVAGMWWSDLSEGTSHLPMDWSRGVAETPVPSSSDYTDECLVSGADGSSTVTAP